MIAAAVGPEFGVLATDSAQFSTETGETSFDSTKLVKIGKYLFTFIGTPLYFVNMDKTKFNLPMDQLCFYLSGFFRGIKTEVEEAMKELIQDTDENQPHLCVYVMGLHGKRPTLAQFNSFLDFKPKYLWSDDKTEFATILYGDDSKPEKQNIFKESTKYMEELAVKFGVSQPGLVGEILSRGIYKKADLEMEIGLKKKYAGGMVRAASLKKDGLIYSLCPVEVLDGSI